MNSAPTKMLTFDETMSGDGLDGWGNYVGDHDIAPLLVCCGQNRDSDAVQRSNFRCMLQRLGGESDTVQVHRFGHWACGWHELILIDPADTGAVQTADKVLNGLDDYPVVCDEDLSELENEEFNESWEAWVQGDFERAVWWELGLDDEPDGITVDWYSLWCDLNGAYRSDDVNVDYTASGVSWWQIVQHIPQKELDNLKQAAIMENSKRGGTVLDCRWIWDGDFSDELPILLGADIQC